MYIDVTKNYYPTEDENVFESLTEQYERIIVESLITSFGLDFLVSDKYGGDVDTIHNVRNIDCDEKLVYKSMHNANEYIKHSAYDSNIYHHDSGFINSNRQYKVKKEEGVLFDEYTGEKLSRNAKTDLDHIISAKEINDDRARVLSGLNGVDLANNPTNLKITNPHLNRSKGASSMDEYLDKHSSEYTAKEIHHMKEVDKESRKHYNQEISRAYYLSDKFAKDIMLAATNVGIRMGIRQALGLIFWEMWIEVKKRLKMLDKDKLTSDDIKAFLSAVKDGIEEGYKVAKTKYKELIQHFFTGMTAGFLASITTTICNIFFTTSENLIWIIRQSYSTLLEAVKILIFNPKGYLFGDRLKLALKIISVGTSVVIGGIVRENISKLSFSTIPGMGRPIKTFITALCTGIMSYTLLYYIDRNQAINKVVFKLNSVNTVDKNARFYKEQALLFEKNAAEILSLDLNIYREQTNALINITNTLTTDISEEEFNTLIQNTLKALNLTPPWVMENTSFNEFMNDKTSIMVFK